MNTPSIVTSAMIYELMLSVNRKLDQILDKKIEVDVKEISINKLSRLTGKSYKYWYSEIENGLPARKVPSGRRKEGFTYQIRVKDLESWQKSKQEEPGYEPEKVEIESTASIIRRVMNKHKLLKGVI